MNIFVLDTSPVLAAQYQCDKHVVKMIVESAQMLSTAHRLLDGKMNVVRRPVKTKIVFNDHEYSPIDHYRKVKVWKLDDKKLDEKLYAVAHPGHPSTKWTMESLGNYLWHYQHFCALCDEYTHRYSKTHATDTKLRFILDQAPANIPDDEMTPFKLAMMSNPECMDSSDPVGSYRKFYQTKQGRFKMVWTNRDRPDWFVVNT
jgi:hypothetical protein